jgi:Tfp pilus assembly protein PilF
MIYVVIAILVLVIAGLFVDWSKLPEHLRRREPSSLKPAPARRRDDPKEFTFDVPVLEELPSNQIVERVAENTSPEVQDLLDKADVHFRKGEMKAAEDLYVQAAAKDPRCSKAYGRLGVIYLEQGDALQDAEDAFRQALKTDPQNGYILNNLGLVLYHQDKYADAIRQFEQAVRLDELNAARHANLGMAYLAMRQYAKAESSFKKALKLAPHEMEYKDLLNESIEKKKAHKTMIRH